MLKRNERNKNKDKKISTVILLLKWLERESNKIKGTRDVEYRWGKEEKFDSF